MRTKMLGILAVFTIAIGLACNSQRSGTVSYEDQVKSSLQQAELSDVNVSEDKDKNTITLSGKVHSENAKEDAARIAQAAAGSRVIVNEISVQPEGAESQARDIEKNTDDAIESTYKAALTAQGLGKENINCDAKNGVLKLTGSVKSPPRKQEAEKLAQAIPNVQQVVNEIEVRR